MNGKETIYNKTLNAVEERIGNCVLRYGEPSGYKKVTQEEAFFGREMRTNDDGDQICCDSNVIKALDKDWKSYTTLH